MVLAIHKPTTISSAQVLRDLQQHFDPSTLFAPWLAREREARDAESRNQKQKRSRAKRGNPKVKIGHGGTLDPLATGVLVAGIGKGTKELGRFLECTKSYEAVILFGASTDTYDCVGKVIGRKSYNHVTEALVRTAMDAFRGKIMQVPPIYSALRVQGKHLYEYAREGKEVPIEIKARPVEVLELELVEWMDGGRHSFKWPEEEAKQEECDVAEKLQRLQSTSIAADSTNGQSSGNDLKRKHSDDEVRPTAGAPLPSRIRRNSSSEVDEQDHRASTAIRSSFTLTPDDAAAVLVKSHDITVSTNDTHDDAAPASIIDGAFASAPQGVEQPIFQTPVADNDDISANPAPAAKIRMTVTSGFYVRSLCHDLGLAVGSMALMSSLVRTRQGQFELGKNVLEYDALAKGEAVWGPQVECMLSDWNKHK